MQAISSELRQLIEEYLPRLEAVPEEQMNFKPLPKKWSKKEIIGHLADSAQNNIRRFIVAQYEDEPHIVYKQDEWVNITSYQQYDLDDLIQLWWVLNKHICHILENITPEQSRRICRSENSHTIEWLAADYIKHLKHHIHQVLNLEPFDYP